MFVERKALTRIAAPSCTSGMYRVCGERREKEGGRREGEIFRREGGRNGGKGGGGKEEKSERARKR